MSEKGKAMNPLTPDERNIIKGGMICFGAIGLGAGLIFLSFTQAIGLCLVSAMVGGLFGARIIND